MVLENPIGLAARIPRHTDYRHRIIIHANEYLYRQDGRGSRTQMASIGKTRSSQTRWGRSMPGEGWRKGLPRRDPFGGERGGRQARAQTRRERWRGSSAAKTQPLD